MTDIRYMWGYVIIIAILMFLVLLQDQNAARERDEMRRAKDAAGKELEFWEKKASRAAQDAAWSRNEVRYLKAELEKAIQKQESAAKIIKKAGVVTNGKDQT